MPPPTQQSRILIIDDDPGVQECVGETLSDDGYAIDYSADGLSAIDSTIDLNPDLLILDLTLPGLDGFEVCERLRTWYQGSILVLSGTGDSGAIVRALDLGADDYIVKPFRTKELQARVRALLRRSTSWAISQEISAGDLRFNLAQRVVTGPKGAIQLTRTEYDILAFLAKHADRVVTADSVLTEVWGPHHGEYAQTLRVHIGHIRKKIEANPSEPVLLQTEPGVGYRFNSKRDEKLTAAAPA